VYLGHALRAHVQEVAVGVRLAFRALRRSPWFFVTVVGTIALSISLAATVFAVVDGVLFKPLPYSAPERLFHVQGSAGAGQGTASLAPADVRYLDQADPRVRVTGYGVGAALTHASRPDVAIASGVIDERFFDVLGQHPLVGGFRAEHYSEPAPVGRPRPAIVSYGFWQQWLGGDAKAIGRTVDMAGARLTIVGVLPRDFVFPTAFGRVRPDVLVPRTSSAPASRDRWSRSLNAVARLDEAIDVEEARVRLGAALAARVDEYTPRRMRPGPYVAVSMRPLEVYLGANERPLFRLAFAGAALLVILGAVNVAGLFAARGRDRERELTIRVALGAGRVQLGKLMMCEALVVALAGSIIGLLIARPSLTVALALLPEQLLLLKSPRIDWRVVVFAIGTAIVVVTAFALVPAVAAVRHALAQRMSGGGMSTPRSRSWGRSALLAAESAIGICLVVAGSLTLASFIALRGEDVGFNREGLAVLEVRTPNAATPAEIQATHARVFERLRAAPGVAALATVGVPLLENMFGGSQFAIPDGANRFFVNDIPVAGAFFDAAGLRVLDGRILTDMEIEAGRPFVVVSDAVAREYWPRGRAVGQTLVSKERSVTVVGVVEEARFGAQDEVRMGEIYLPASLARSTATVYLVRTAGDPDAVVRGAALAVQGDVPGVLVRRAESFDGALWKSVRDHRFRTMLFGTSAASSLLLVAVGIAGLVATAVARRVREMEIRRALGAERGQLVNMVVLDHLRPALAGVGLGLLASWWTTRLLSAYLYEIDAHEPAVWAAAAFGLLVVAAVAAWIPARRASRVEAIAVLKAE
jgi:putative ABC transport system permease protein